jgi:hypothetical protein
MAWKWRKCVDPAYFFGRKSVGAAPRRELLAFGGAKSPDEYVGGEAVSMENNLSQKAREEPDF